MQNLFLPQIPDGGSEGGGRRPSFDQMHPEPGTGTAPVVMPKRIYLARRNPRLTREQFRMRWRQHGALAMSQRTWGESAIHYTQSDPVLATGGLLGASDEFDGIGIILHQSLETQRRRLDNAEERARILKDEDETFAARVNTFGNSASERLLRDGPRSGVKAYRFLWRRAGATAADFQDGWKDHATVLLGTPTVSRYIRRYAQNDPLDPPVGTSWGLDCDGIEETWYESLDVLLRAHAEAAYAAIIEADRARLVTRCILVLAVDVVLYDARDPSAVDGAVYPPAA